MKYVILLLILVGCQDKYEECKEILYKSENLELLCYKYVIKDDLSKMCTDSVLKIRLQYFECTAEALNE